MNAEELGLSYDKIADWWEQTHKDSSYGVDYVEKAIGRSVHHRRALDVGCGSGGRIIETIVAAGYDLTAIDVSAGMISIAREKHPGVAFVNANFMTWRDEGEYDLVIAWDSIFHAPRALQRPVVQKLCRHLAPEGILLFTAGGLEGDISGEMNGVPFEYGSLDYLEYLRVISDSGCEIMTMERDQPMHMVFLCRGKND